MTLTGKKPCLGRNSVQNKGFFGLVFCPNFGILFLVGFEDPGFFLYVSGEQHQHKLAISDNLEFQTYKGGSINNIRKHHYFVK